MLVTLVREAAPQTTDEIQAALVHQLDAKTITLREFHPGKEVRFTSDGQYKGKDEQGSWTLWSKLLVTAVQVRPEAVTIKGPRVHVAYNAKQGGFVNVRSKQQATVVIEFANTAITSNSVRAALEKIFLGKEEHLSAVVPEEWECFLRVEESGSLQSLPACEPKQKDHGLSRTLPATEAPKVISAPDPEYQKEAREARLQGTVILVAFVNEDGRVSNVRISRPLGMGLDEKGVEAVRKWRFQPAKRAGVPVRFQINIEVNFRLW